MNDYSRQHKAAWEYDAYNFWVRTSGPPEECARQSVANPKGMLRRYAAYFDRYEGDRVANICGSCGKKAIPLALLGAEVTVFDISEDNRRYALEMARAAGVGIDFEVCDILEIDLAKYGGRFDVVFMEGGILHYFHDLGAFMAIMYALLKPGGKVLIGDVAFRDRAAQDRCRMENGDGWDEDEHYFVYEDLQKALPDLTFTQLSPCAGLLTLAGKERI